MKRQVSELEKEVSQLESKMKGLEGDTAKLVSKEEVQKMQKEANDINKVQYFSLHLFYF